MKRLMVVAGLLASCLTASAAEAKVPRFGSLTIVPGQSIGGVKVGMTKAQAFAVWRSADRCSAEKVPWCQYLAVSTLQGGFKINQPFAGFYLRAGRVAAVGLESAENAAVDRKVVKLKTSKGIHVGSTMAAARRAYKIGPPTGGEAGRSRAVFKQPGNRCTLFYAPTAPYTKIEAIQVGRCGVGLA